ncbi:MAG: hypothetical protein KKA81_13410 [Bacteroidetes bacterium]|nr:hypothetical protein [Bacteroidota bacterium]
MKRKAIILMTAVSLLAGSSTWAQLGDYDDENYFSHTINIGVEEVALLDIEPELSATLTLGPEAPEEAGLPVVFNSTATDNSLWLNYSSIIGSTTEPTRKVTVAITTGTVPDGMLLKVAAAADAGQGDGTVGTPQGTLTLSSTAQDLVTGIGSCYTGSPQNNGHNLTYTLELNSALGSYAELDFDAQVAVEITYTLTDN